jgi:hypothetical protein
MKSVEKILKASPVSAYGNREYELLLECGHKTMRTLKWDMNPKDRKFRCTQCLVEKWKKEGKSIKEIPIK